MLWIHYNVGVSHFAECCEHWPVSDCVINANKFAKMPHFTLAREVEVIWDPCLGPNHH